MKETIENVYNVVIRYGMDVAGAIVIFIIGRMAAKFISNVAEVAMVKAGLDKTLASFGKHLSFYGIMTFACIAALNKLGVETTSFIAVVGAASFAVGLALQGSLSNFASGVLIIVFQPFKVGDTVIISDKDVQGSVEEIQIFNTILSTADKKIVIVPNSKVTGNNITVIHQT